MQDKSVTTIPARVFDPSHRAWWILGLGAALMTAGLVVAFETGSRVGGALMLFGIATSFAWDMRLRHSARDRKLLCKPGFVDTGGGLIRARDIEGATTARVGDKVALVLSHRRRRREPVIFELEDETALHTVCKSLGIGHHGFGFIDFVTEGSRLELASRLLCALSVVATLSMFFEPLLPFGITTLFVTFTSIFTIACVRFGTRPPFARITASGVFLPSGMFVAFRSIEEVQVLAGALVFRIKTDRGTPELRVPIRTVVRARQGMTRDELEHIALQIRAASERAHGKFATKDEKETLAARLDRNKDETDADWRARLDTIGGGGYRALSAEPAELWALLEDPEAPIDVRAGAARVLRRIDKTALRVRIADVLATVRDEQTRTRIADSIEEDDEAPPDSQSAAHS
jgi:hypothetical protein